MNIKVENKITVILASFAKNATCLQIFNRELEDVSDQEGFDYLSGVIGLINVIHVMKDDSIHVLNLQFPREDYIKICSRKRNGSKFVEGPIINVSINDFYESIINKDSESFIKKFKIYL